MDGHKSQTKLTRTHSSLLRSSPTIRSSIHSFSSVSEIEETFDVEEQKLHSKPCNPPVRSNASRFVPLLAAMLLSAYTLFAFFYWDEMTTSENLLLSLIFFAVLLFFVVKNKVLVVKSVVFCKQLGDEYGKRLVLSCFSSRNQSKPVEWFIGESSSDSLEEVQENVGEVSFSKIVREGVEFYSNGDIYEGEFYKGRCNGSGVYNFIVNGRYEGDWVDGKYEGYGIESWARGSRYKGQYRQGLRHGYGVYKFYTGDTYAGEWCNGRSYGVGMQSCADGSCYVGEFKSGVKHGLGCYHFRNGDRYAGEYFGDKIHGFGVYHFANGHCYEGSWHEGRKQGYGMYTFRNGVNRSGEWDGGNLKTTRPPLTDAVLRAVQAARKTADNALHLRRVDENVDRAVAAANKAATAARVAAVKAVQNRIHQKFSNTNSR